MKKYGKRLISISIFLVALTILPILAIAQDPGDPGEDPDAPIDGGVGLLVVAGIGYGIKKAKDRKNKMNTINLTEIQDERNEDII